VSVGYPARVGAPPFILFVGFAGRLATLLWIVDAGIVLSRSQAEPRYVAAPRVPPEDPGGGTGEAGATTNVTPGSSPSP
jgi:hypothetical protein